MRHDVFSFADKRPQIAGSLTNIQSASAATVGSLTNAVADKAKQEQQQDESSQEDAEDRKQREHQWKMMKYSLIACGISLSVMGSITVYELARPMVDENGNIIEDEFSSLPYFLQMWKRLTRELNYYKKVNRNEIKTSLVVVLCTCIFRI